MLSLHRAASTIFIVILSINPDSYQNDLQPYMYAPTFMVPYKTRHNEKGSEKVCRNPHCQERHPKTCKFYERNGDCWWKEECAYEHKKSYNINKIDMLEEEVMNLKNHINEINIDEDTKKIEVLENSLKVLQQQFNALENELRASHKALEEDTSCKTSDSMKDVPTQDTLNCTDCEYQCEKNISMVKHFNTKHRKSLKCFHCSEMFRDNDALEDHKMKDD